MSGSQFSLYFGLKGNKGREEDGWQPGCKQCKQCKQFDRILKKKTGFANVLCVRKHIQHIC